MSQFQGTVPRPRPKRADALEQCGLGLCTAKERVSRQDVSGGQSLGQKGDF
jgi:hypothetical protein